VGVVVGLLLLLGTSSCAVGRASPGNEALLVFVGTFIDIQVTGERLRIPADAAFNIEHARSGDRQALAFQLLWSAGPD
jgi:hypothetical protein